MSAERRQPKKRRAKRTKARSEPRAGIADRGEIAGLAGEVASHHETGPALSGGDVDANWQRAHDSGEEAVGGSVATPDQDVVDEIGRALGVEYADDEELQGGAEIADRDRHRWELDPSSKDDFDEET
jgi:hypothetical protein